MIDAIPIIALGVVLILIGWIGFAATGLVLVLVGLLLLAYRSARRP